jgi:hypothetical protein
MLEEQHWGLAILVSQKLVRALPKPTWRVVLEEDQWISSKHLYFISCCCHSISLEFSKVQRNSTHC